MLSPPPARAANHYPRSTSRWGRPLHPRGHPLANELLSPWMTAYREAIGIPIQRTCPTKDGFDGAVLDHHPFNAGRGGLKGATIALPLLQFMGFFKHDFDRNRRSFSGGEARRDRPARAPHLGRDGELRLFKHRLQDTIPLN